MASLRDEWVKFKKDYPDWVKSRPKDLGLGKTLDEIEKEVALTFAMAEKIKTMADDLVAKGDPLHKKMSAALLAYREAVTKSTMADKDKAAKALDEFRNKAANSSAWFMTAAKHFKVVNLATVDVDDCHEKNGQHDDKSDKGSEHGEDSVRVEVARSV